MKGRIFNKNNSIKTKSIILSVVSIIELIVLLATMTFAWFEGLTSLEIKGENLSTASELKSKFIVGEGTDYSTTAELNEFFHKQSFDKLSPVSSWDGDNFYAITTGETPESQTDYITAVNNRSVTFRKLSEEEKLSSIIYFQFEITSDSSDTDFWFKKLPAVKINGTALNSENNPFRFSFDDGTGANPNNANNYNFTTREEWPSGNQANIRAIKSIDANGYATLNNTATEPVSNRASFSVFGTEDNEDGTYKLFTVPKGQTKIITVAIWIEAFDPAYNENIIPPGATVELDVEFCSSWDVVDDMVFRDYTADQWVDATDEAQSNKAMKFGAVNLDSDSKYYYPFTYNSSEKQWTADIPRAVQNIKFVWQGLNDTSVEDNVWNPVKRNNNKVFTAFGSTAGIWYDGVVEHITFSDYTSDHWVNNDGAKIKAQITYEGDQLNYSMTASPTQDSAGKNTWSLFIPTAVDTVVFNRVGPSDATTALNTWKGIERNNENRYYAIDGGQTEVVEGTAIYLTIPLDYYNKNYNFNDNFKPAITFTSSNNATAVENAKKSNGLQNMLKSNYVTSGQHCDTWPGTNGEMKELKRTSSNIYFVYYLDYELPEGTYLTFWSKTHVNSNGGFNNIDNNVTILPAVKYEGGKNQFAISGFTQFTDSAFGGGCYAVTGYQTATYSGSDGNVVKPGKEQRGQWGAPDLPDGTYQTWFVHTASSGISWVKATFEYYGEEWTIDLTQNTSDARKWYTSNTAIPDDVTVITFTDSAGHTWTSTNMTGTRTKTTNYFYATSNTAGKWSAQITPPSGTYKTYFVPPSGNTATSVTITYTYSGVTFSTTITAKDSNGYFATQAIPDAATNIVIKDNAGHTWTTGTGRTSTNCYFMATSNTAGTWGKPASAKRTIYLVPNNEWKSGGSIFRAWVWGSDTEADQWIYFTDSDGDGKYEAEVGADFTDIIFLRATSGSTAWNGEQNRIQTTLSESKDTFTVTGLTTGTWDTVTVPTDVVIYVDFTNAGSNWGSGHYLSIRSSSNSSYVNATNTSGANVGSYVPKNDTWIGSGTLVSGKLYKWTIPADKVSQLKSYGFTVWSVNESSYSDIWQTDVSHVSYSTTYNTYTISSNYTTNSNRQADCFTLTASKNN